MGKEMNLKTEWIKEVKEKANVERRGLKGGEGWVSRAEGRERERERGRIHKEIKP